jgi:hypothetical protein
VSGEHGRKRGRADYKPSIAVVCSHPCIRVFGAASSIHLLLQPVFSGARRASEGILRICSKSRRHLLRIILNKPAGRAVRYLYVVGLFRAVKSSTPNAAAAPLRSLYVALVVLGALVTHLASEFFGMGAHDDGAVVFSVRHIYLGLAALACALVVFGAARSFVCAADGLRDLKRMAANALAGLPFGGGWRFVALTAAAQFVIGIGSAVGEGCFFCSHDAFFGIAGALLTASFLAVVSRLVACRLPKLAAQLAAVFLPQSCDERNVRACVTAPMHAVRRSFWSPQLANRPPPLRRSSALI